jgi:AcrR family transcriptional regulator
VKLTLDRIVDAGMATFAEHGYAGLSMRQVAQRLGVHAGSLYYHVKNKDALLRLLADRIAGEAYAAGTAALDRLPPGALWTTKIEEQLLALRRTLRRHAGGPVLLAASPALLSTGALSLMERLLATLAEAGVPSEHRAVAADTLLSHVTGFVLQEQAEPPAPDRTAVDATTLRQRFPMTMAAASAHTPDEMFRQSLRLQCAAITTLTAHGTPRVNDYRQPAR